MRLRSGRLTHRLIRQTRPNSSVISAFQDSAAGYIAVLEAKGIQDLQITPLRFNIGFEALFSSKKVKSKIYHGHVHSSM
jgi:hypothetical protein